MLASLPLTQVVLRFFAALVCGALLGWERESQHKPAGFRTNIMIVLGAAAYTVVALGIASNANGELAGGPADVLRLVQGIAGGIGFLGAGAIIQASGSIKGMTTAATIWALGAIGLACGAGQFAVAFAAVGFSMLVLTGLGFLEKRLTKNRQEPRDERADHTQ